MGLLDLLNTNAAIRNQLEQKLANNQGTEQQQMLAAQVKDMPLTGQELGRVVKSLNPDYVEGLAYSSIYGPIAQGRERLGAPVTIGPASANNSSWKDVLDRYYPQHAKNVAAVEQERAKAAEEAWWDSRR